MRAIFRTLICLVYLASAMLAQAGYVINSFQFGGAPAPTITNTFSVLTQGASTPFASNLNLSAFSKDAIVCNAAWGRNQDLTFGTVTLGGVAPDVSVESEDNGAADRAGNATYLFLTASTSSSVALSIGVTSSNPDSWRVQCFGLLGVNQTTPTVTTAHSETASVAAKNVTVDTTGYAGNTLVIGGRTHARSATITCTPTGSISEVTDAGSGSQSLWVGKVENMTPASLSFGCTGSATDDGDALSVMAIRG